MDGTNYENQVVQAVDWLRQRAESIFGKLKLEVLKPGDVNNDGEVTIADVAILIDYLLDSDIETFNLDNADVNDDGNITIADVTALIDKLLSSD